MLIVCCTWQIKAEKSAARAKFDVCARIEENERKALVAEENMLEEFKTVWEVRLEKVAKGSPPYFMIQAEIDQYDLRLDVVTMEKRMYVPMYLKRAEPHKPFDTTPATNRIKWIYEKEHSKLRFSPRINTLEISPWDVIDVAEI